MRKLIRAVGTALLVASLGGCQGGSLKAIIVDQEQRALGYAVTYDANGASSGSVPVDGNRYRQGQTVTIPGNPGNLAKSGYSFIGWNSKADGSGTNYTQGQTFTMGSADVTLHARWTNAVIYAVTYDPNGATSGTVPSDTTNYLVGQTVVVLGNPGGLARNGYSFQGWSTAASGSGTTYSPGQTFTMGSSLVTLYASWINTSASWNEVDMGIGSTLTLGKIAVGAGRNDGVVRVYAGESSAGNGGILEYSYGSGSWSLAPVVGTSNVTEIRGLQVADVHNNGTVGVYADGYNLAEYLFSGSSWSGNILGTSVYLEWVGGGGMALGTRGNESYSRIYVPDYKMIVELSYDYGDWDELTIPMSDDPDDLVVADGHNDGQNRIYVIVGTFGGHVFEYSWNSSTSTWQLTSDVSGAGFQPWLLVTAGVGRNDGVKRIYAWGEDGLYEFSYGSGTWSNTMVTSATFTDVLSQNGMVRLGDGRNDGKMRLYTASDSGVGEYTYSSGAWSKTALIRSGASGGVAIGNGRSDSPAVNRVYATGGTHVYEYTPP